VRPSSFAHHALSLLAGLVFGAGLVVSGMTQPVKVLGFLDVYGRFDASLIFVMLGAIAVHFVAYRYRNRRQTPLFTAEFKVPTRRDIDAKLVIGALVFGAGWGLGGYCPGPALVSLPAGSGATFVFVAAMVLGMFVTDKLSASLARGRDAAVTPRVLRGSEPAR
jgi:uncharacterized membrane protein YedE/YeeE